jgi:uncharacterized protein YqgV (UPF0045/DUF77 family)
MRKKTQNEIQETKFKRAPEITLEDGKIIYQGDIIKVRGEYGVKFKFQSLTTNVESGAQWVDCFEVFRGQVGAFRSFQSDRIKRIPKKRVKKNVSRRPASTTP